MPEQPPSNPSVSEPTAPVTPDSNPVRPAGFVGTVRPEDEVGDGPDELGPSKHGSSPPAPVNVEVTQPSSPHEAAEDAAPEGVGEGVAGGEAPMMSGLGDPGDGVEEADVEALGTPPVPPPELGPEPEPAA